MKRSTIGNLLAGYSAFLLVCVTSCGVYDRFHDQGRELVNAAGLSTNETLKLVLAGADVNKRCNSHFGWTPLISAVYHHKEDVVDLLLKYGANPNVGDDHNQTAIVWAIQCWGDSTNVLLKLLTYGADPTIKNKLGSDAFDAARSRNNASAIFEVLRAFESKKPTASTLGQGRMPTETLIGLPHNREGIVDFTCA
jgi:ankyrin repeat protein